jgi:hypothetical protein
VAQLSLPYRIGLVALLVIGALWVTVLKPKDPAVEPAAPAPGVTGLAADAGAAKGATNAGDASAAATQAAANSVGTTPSATGTSSTGGTAAGTTSAADTAAPRAKAASVRVATEDRSAPLLRALDRDRAVVLLFWNRRGSDDAAVRRAVSAVDRRGGRAVVQIASIRDVGRYQAITRGVQVLASPTVLVIAPGRTARPITGLTTTGELDQAVGDTLAAARKSARKG